MNGCPVHGLSRWIESVPHGYGYCQQCAIDADPHNRWKLGDTTGDEHNGAGCYDSDSDFS